MKITDVKTYIVGAPARNWIYVKVLTDEGIEGIGEAYSVGPDEGTVAVIHDFKRWLIGEDPLNIEKIWQKMYYFTRFPGGSVINSAISGIEHALWDIAGKNYGVPVYMLLGGKCREKVRCYQSVGGSTPEELAENAKHLVREYGYTALKFDPIPNSTRRPFNLVVEEAVERTRALREALGYEVDIALDVHAKIFEPSNAVKIAKAVEKFAPLFLEEPVRPEDIDALASVTSKVQVPIASGEELYTKFEFAPLIERRAVDIVQPDVCCAGGILECKKIAAMAEAHYISVAPHQQTCRHNAEKHPARS
ncbi:mandelate racemase/muconate lactonizing enzyme family protein, partial [Candidatus Bathyarchaeota archaeon]